LNDALGDTLAKIVLSTVWPARASFLKRDFHRSHRLAVEAFTPPRTARVDAPLSAFNCTRKISEAAFTP
jgi:hypothetical protein